MLREARNHPEFAPNGKYEEFRLWLDWYDAQLEGLPRSLFGETKDIKLATQEDAFWRGDAHEVMERVAELVGWPSSTEVAEETVGELEPQNTAAITFKADPDGLIIVDHNPRADELATDENATNRHGEVLRLTNKLINSFDPSEQGANAAAEIIEDVRLFHDTLGEQSSATNIDFLIPRGDGLRNILTAQANKDEMSDLPPISDKYLTHLKNLIGAYNVYVSIDPVLAERDEAIYGPDVVQIMGTPEDGRKVIENAIELNIAKNEVAEALDEEAKVAPEIPSLNNRASRRLNQAFKNFSMKALDIILHNKHTENACEWLLSNEKWLLENYKNKPHVKTIIKTLCDKIRKPD
ncbi:MAG: hypothetical protein V3V02_02920 [Rhizobiaceae bacterium]